MDTTDDKLWDLLADWESRYRQGEEVSPEELCRDCPELLAEVQNSIASLKRFDERFGPQPEHAQEQPSTLGEYTILEPIGSGGMGQVYKALHRRMDRIVALKVLPREMIRSAEALERFQQEVRSAAKLSHPNIVTAYDAGDTEGGPFLAMELVEGQDLLRYVQKHGPLPLEKAVDYVVQAARGLGYAHERGILHGDVTPANLLLGNDGVVKVLDLGLSRLRQGDACNDSVTGTVDFLAPEQTSEPRRLDHRSDIYSLGCTLYFLVTGKPIYDGKTVIQKIVAHQEQPVPPLPPVDAVFRKMVAKKPEERFQSMAEVIEALQQPPAKPRNGQLLGIGAIVLVLLVGGIGYFGFPAKNGEAPPKKQPIENAKKAIPLQPDDLSFSQDRKAAEWVLQMGGSLSLIDASMKNGLPQKPFQIRGVLLDRKPITDEGLKHFQGLKRLAELRVNDTPITDAGLAHIRDLSRLEMLELRGTGITGDGVKYLKDSPLNWLELSGTAVNDEGLKHLKELPKLRTLRLNALKITDAGLEALAELPDLRLLEIAGSRITDGGMKHIAKMRKLNWLMLTGTKVSDVGLEEIHGLDGLRQLWLERTKNVTDAGVAKLKAALPKCRVMR